MIYLHIGQPKTGTSILQNALLAASGTTEDFVYPKSFLGPGVGHHTLANTLKSDEEFDPAIAQLRETMAAASGRDVFFSSESFSNMVGPRRWPVFSRMVDILREYDDLSVLVYQRRFDDFLNSMFLQSARYGRREKFPDRYVMPRIKRVSTWFDSVAGLEADPRFELRYTAVRKGFNILDDIAGLSGNYASVLKDYKLPQTEKFSLKLQIFISFHQEICGEDLPIPQMNRLVIKMRQEGIRLTDDKMKYTVIPEAHCQEAAEAALQAAEAAGIAPYVAAFREGGTTLDEFVGYDPDMLTAEDIATLREIEARVA